jgi:DNA helicase-2/ATP-dependent DNA helicase PcrA
MVSNTNTVRKLNTEQKKAIRFGDGPLLIIAGAGTGKTTVITERIKYLISSGRAKPSEILALTFTEKASREMEERVDVALPYGVTQMWISTFHSFCDRILRNEGLALGIDPKYRLMTEAETIQFFRANLFVFSLSYYRPLGNPIKFISGMIQHFSRLKDEDVQAEQYLRWIESKDEMENDEGLDEKEKYLELAQAYKTYEELKVKHSVMDYGDLIAYTLKLFRTRKSVLKIYQEQFKYLLIDEFQDTNFAQNELAKLLTGKNQNITVVGDDDQAIYRWRGAAISNIIQFRKFYKKAKIVVLTKNYRSTKEILDRSYQLIQNNNPDRLEVVEKIDKKLECVRRIHGKPITLFFTDRVENEADEIAKEIASLVRTNDSKSEYTWKDVALLVRANTHAEPFIRAFGRKGIPYQFLGPGQLFRQPEVKDLICYLKVLYDIHDSVSFFRVLSMDHFAIPSRDIASLVSNARSQGISLFEMCEVFNKKEQNFVPPSISNEGEKQIIAVVSLIQKHLALIKKETAGQILYFFLEESGLLQAFASYNTPKDELVAENIAKFFDKLKTYEADHEDASVFTVVDWLDLSMDLGESPLASNTDWNAFDAVNILTVHSAKGLEFPIVFLVNLVGARFPTTEKHEQIPLPDELVKEILPVGDYHTEEERRLFYVGMTRARDLLYFSASQYYGEGKREKKISPFVTETIGDKTTALSVMKSEVKEKQLLLIDWAKQKEEQCVPSKVPIHYLSYSQVETFDRCPLQYKYRYILKIPVPTSAALSFGDTIHRTLHAFFEKVQQKEYTDKSVVLKIYQDLWRSEGYRDKDYEEKMKQHGVFLLEEFYDKGFDRKIHVLALEQPFKVKITPTLTLGGKIDRIDRTEEGKLEIIDYKTGSAPKKRDPSEDMQLSVYALAAYEQGVYGEKVENILVSFYFLEGQQKISGTRNKEQLEKVKQSVSDTAEQISVSSFAPKPGKHCDFCEFRLICEAWK